MTWARVKGEAENELRALGLARLFCFRPGYIHADDASAVTEPAMAMIEATMSSVPGAVLNNTQIRTVGLARRPYKAGAAGASWGCPPGTVVGAGRSDASGRGRKSGVMVSRWRQRTVRAAAGW